MNSYIMINQYRSSTSSGFSNTWVCKKCTGAKQRNRILRDGLPVRDQWFLDRDGIDAPAMSTFGVRACTRAERDHAKRWGVMEIDSDG